MKTSLSARWPQRAGHWMMSPGNGRSMTSNESTFAGYIFAPRLDPRCPGHSRLEVFLRAEPTQEHFDPEYVRLTLVPEFSGNPMPEITEIGYPWPSLKPLAWAIGPIDIVDRKGSKVDGFGFGGSLQAATNSSQTHLVLDSAAPILELVGPGAFANDLTEEVEVLLAELSAQAGMRLSELEIELAKANPLALYLASLMSIRRKLSGIDRKGPPPYQQLIRKIDAALMLARELGHNPELAPSFSMLTKAIEDGD